MKRHQISPRLQRLPNPMPITPPALIFLCLLLYHIYTYRKLPTKPPIVKFLGLSAKFHQDYAYAAHPA